MTVDVDDVCKDGRMWGGFACVGHYNVSRCLWVTCASTCVSLLLPAYAFDVSYLLCRCSTTPTRVAARWQQWSPGATDFERIVVKLWSGTRTV